MRAVSAERLIREISSHHFAVLATSATHDVPHSAGVSYGSAIENGSLVIYVMTRRHLRKARDIAAQARVSLVIPLERRLLWLVPPGTIQLSGRAELLPQGDERGVSVSRSFLLGRRILRAYRAMSESGERRVCFVRIAVDPLVQSYMVGVSLVSVLRRMESGTASTHLTASPVALDPSQTAEPQLEQRPARSETLEPHDRQRRTPVASVRVLRRLS
jgi:hypothetical protein